LGLEAHVEQRASFEAGGLFVGEDERIAVGAVHARDGGVGPEALEVRLAPAGARRLVIAGELGGGAHFLRQGRLRELVCGGGGGFGAGGGGALRSSGWRAGDRRQGRCGKGQRRGERSIRGQGADGRFHSAYLPIRAGYWRAGYWRAGVVFSLS